MTPENLTGIIKHKISMPELILLLLSTLTAMAGATLAPVLPILRIHFIETSNVDILVRLSLSTTPLFIAIGAPIMGVIVDKWGRKNLVFLTTILYGFAGSAGFFLDSLEAIIVSRAVLGVSVAGIMTTSTTLIADYFQGEQRNKVMGYQGSFLTYGGIIFLLVGGLLAGIGWQFPFLIYLLAFPLVPAIWIYLYEPDRTIPSATSIKKQLPSSSNSSSPYLALGVVYVLTLVFQIVFYSTLTELPFFLSNFLLLDTEFIGIVLATATFSAGTFSLLYNQIKRRIDFGPIFAASFMFSGGGLFLIFFSADIFSVVLSLLIAGVGLGLFVPNSTVWITSVTPESSRGLVLSGFMSSLFFGQFISPFVSQFLLQYIPITEMFALIGLFLFLIGAVFIVPRYFLNSKTPSAYNPEL